MCIRIRLERGQQVAVETLAQIGGHMRRIQSAVVLLRRRQRNRRRRRIHVVILRILFRDIHIQVRVEHLRPARIGSIGVRFIIIVMLFIRRLI